MLIVQKYGGTSVGSIARIRNVAAHVRKTRAKGHDVIVVVSAMSGETNRLLELVHAMQEEPVERESDVVVASGEQVSAGLLALALHAQQVPAVSLLGHQIPIVTDDIFSRARMRWINPDEIRKQLAAGNVVVVPGFQGVTETGEITTLGRGGSDTSAVAVAAALHADSCEIYTDVEGIFSTDPNLCPAARKIDRMEYEELLEMAGAGAKVVQMRAVQLAARFQVPMHVRSAFEADTMGTCVVAEDPRMEATLVSGVTATLNEAKISVRQVPDRPGVAMRLFEPLARANINLDMIVQTTNESGESDIGFTVAKEDLKKTLQLTEATAREIGAKKVEAAGDVSKISIIGLGMRSHAGVAAKMFETLASEAINIQLISTSEIKVSVVVNMSESERAAQALHRAFGLDRKADAS